MILSLVSILVAAVLPVIPAPAQMQVREGSYKVTSIDPCRHFLSVEEINKQITILSYFKYNVMHWHLTDDQGWRIEIRRYPRLTQVGGPAHWN